MKVLALSGSRNPQGQTAQAVEALLQGMQSAGAETELLFLPEMKIERCRQCNDYGTGTCSTESRCVIKDDVVLIIDKMIDADIVVMASPVYFGDLSESMRAFLDRMRRARSGNAEYIAKLRDKLALGICVAGGSGGGSFSCTYNLERILLKCEFDVFDIVSVRRQNLELKKQLLESMGAWLCQKR